MNSIRTRLIVIGLALAATLYFLWPTYQFYRLDGERQAFVLKNDSAGLARWDAANKDSYQSAKEKRIKLGLDLRGGVYITMEVDIPTMLYESAQRDAIDETFEQVIKATRVEATQSDRPVLDIFTSNFDKIARPKGKTLLSYFDVGDLGKDVSDEAIVTKLRKNIEDAVDQAEQVIRQRIDRYGVSETTIQKVGGRRLVVELPGVTDKDEVRSLLQTTARLEFKLVRDNNEVAKLLQQVDRILAGKITHSTKPATAQTPAADTSAATRPETTAVAARETTNVAQRETTAVANRDTAADTTRTASADTAAGQDSTVAKADTTSDTSNPYAGLPPAEARRRYQNDHPLSAIVGAMYQANEDAQPQAIDFTLKDFPGGIYTFMVLGVDRDRVKALFHRSDVKSVWPEDMVIAFSAAPVYVNSKDADSSSYAMYVITRDPELTGEAITDAFPSFDQSGKAMVIMQMNADGADTWASITGRNIKKRVAIVLDSAVYSAPVVQSKITGGSSQITGSKDAKEANLLAVVLKAGALKAPVKIIEDRQVGPSLGEDSIKQGVNATLLAAGIVVLFMLMYYGFGGFVADVAVMFNVLITLAILAAFQATLTLPGIGGLVLTIGMAVDGNILVYERIREELAAGRSLKNAVALGYSKAWHAIIDTHITTFLTGAILYWFGTGPIQGFAVTLMIGIAATLFTAIFCTHTVFLYMLDRGATSINFGQPRSQERVAATATA